MNTSGPRQWRLAALSRQALQWLTPQFQ